MIATSNDIGPLKEIGKIVAETLKFMRESVTPGMTTLQLDQLGEDFMNSLGARSAPRLMYRFPGATCICVNHETAHGIPGTKVIRDGDLVNIDVSAEKNGYYSDAGESFVVGSPGPKLATLLAAGRDALENAINIVRPGVKINQIGKAIEETASRAGFTVIRNLGSHGIGKKLHEEPQFIAGYYDAHDRRILEENVVITIEPFISMGAVRTRDSGDGWTLVTKPHQKTVQFEHTLIVTSDGPLIMTQA
ncbi:type I methionyl aminopeptidase [bacterium]|nr:type I methionyl aminopeptidase [bacterium]